MPPSTPFSPTQWGRKCPEGADEGATKALDGKQYAKDIERSWLPNSQVPSPSKAPSPGASHHPLPAEAGRGEKQSASFWAEVTTMSSLGSNSSAAPRNCHGGAGSSA